MPFARPALCASGLVAGLITVACGGGDGEDASFPATAQSEQAGAPVATEGAITGRGITVDAGTLIHASSPAPGHWPRDASGFAGGRIFNDTSPFNTPIDATPPLHRDSARLVAALLERAAGGIVLATSEWTYPTFRAGAGTPRYDVELTADWSPFARLLDVPIPDSAIPDPQDDGHLVVIDLEAGWVYDFWQARRTASGWAASWGNRIALDSDGVYPSGLSARGSGFSTLNGAIWPHEIAQGRIEHALAFSTDPNRAELFVAPATESDGQSNDPLTLPEGARPRLDPSLDLATLNLAPWERTIARAMQEYGIILVDNGSASITLYAVHPASFGGYRTAWALEDGIGFALGIPLDRLQLLAWDEERHTHDFPSEVADPSIYAEPRESD